MIFATGVFGDGPWAYMLVFGYEIGRALTFPARLFCHVYHYSNFWCG